MLATIIILANILTPKTPPIVVMINQYRIEHHLPAVKVKEQACDFSRVRAKEAVKDWSHKGFIKREDALNKTGYYWYENLATGFTKDKDVVNAWIKSPTHRANLLSKMQYICVSRNKNTWAMEGMERF